MKIEDNMKNVMSSLDDEELLDSDVLMTEIGQAIYDHSGAMSAHPPSSRKLIGFAKRWMKEQHNSISSIVNSNPEIKKLAYGAEDRDIRRIAALLNDCLVSPFDGFPVATLSMVIAHFYLDHFVSENKPKI